MYIYRKIIFLIVVFYVVSIANVFATDITVQKLSNGQTVVIQEVRNNPIVTIDTWIKTGSINEDDLNNGISHFLEHLFFKGTKKYPAGEMDKILESKGAVVNAATSKDYTHYYITIPSEYFDLAMELHSDMLTNPQIPRAELEKERKVVLEEIAKDENTPSKQVYENLNKMMYSTHPYKRKVIGTPEVISTITREEILDYFNKYYAPSNITTIIIGDVDTAKATEKVQQCFHSENKKIIKKNIQTEHELQTQKRNTIYTDTQSGYIMIGFRGVNINEKDTYALDVLAQILGGGKTSRLYRNVKEQQGLAYTVYVSNSSYKEDGIFYVSANYIPSNYEKLEKSIFAEINHMRKYGVTDEELDTAKKNIEQETYYSRESNSDIAETLGYTITLTGDTSFYRDYISNIKKVSAKDVQKVAQKYLGVEKSAVSIALPKSYSQKQENVQKKHESKIISQNNNLEKLLLDNNATMIINPHKNNDIIAISIIAKGGEFIEKIPGTATLTAGIMLKGTQNYSSQELAKLMEENGIRIQATSEEDYFLINIQTTTSQIELTLKLLDEIFNRAVYDESEIEKKSSEILSKIKQRRDVPMNIAFENYKTFIYENSVYSNTNKILEKTLPTITRENVINYYREIFNPKNIVISVNGNIQRDILINAFSDIFTNKNMPEVKYSDYKISQLTKQQNITKKVENLQSSWLFLGWRTCGVQDKKDFVILKVIDTLLGSGLSSRLYRNLREKEGLAYNLGSTYSPKMLGGDFVVYIGTNPETLYYSKNKILQEIEKLKMEFVSDSELNNAKERLKGSFIIALETNSEKASTIGLFEALGFGYDFLDEYIKMIDEVTASDIVRVANKYFNNIYVESSVK